MPAVWDFETDPEYQAKLDWVEEFMVDELEQLGGQGYGQVKLALQNEIVGRSRWAPSVFGSQAPDSGNAEILALFGTPEQKTRYLQPLLDGDITSCYSMTEPQGGSDPGLFVTRAERDNGTWVINGEKWFSTNARHATFFIVMAVTNPDARTRASRSSATWESARNHTPPMVTSATPTCGCRPTTYSAAKGRPSLSRRPGWAAAASITPCAPSRWPGEHST